MRLNHLTVSPYGRCQGREEAGTKDLLKTTTLWAQVLLENRTANFLTCALIYVLALLGCMYVENMRESWCRLAAKSLNWSDGTAVYTYPCISCVCSIHYLNWGWVLGFFFLHSQILYYKCPFHHGEHTEEPRVTTIVCISILRPLRYMKGNNVISPWNGGL